MKRYLTETSMLDFSAPVIENLIERHGWRSLSEFERMPYLLLVFAQKSFEVN